MRTLPSRWLAVVVAVALVFAACGGDSASVDSSLELPEVSVTTEAPAASPSPRAVVRAAEVEFLADRSEQLDVYHPEDSGPWPVVVVVHGHFQIRSDVTDLAEAMASEGAVVFNVDYLDRFPFVTAVEQVACAVRFARASAPQFGGSPESVVLVGHSIGAFIALNVALAGDDHRSGCATSEGSALPDAFVGYEGPYDLAERYHEGSGLDYRTMKEDDPDLWESVNPYSTLGRHSDLVVRLIHGDYADDDRVFGAVAESETFRDLLIEAGYDAELIVVEGALHGSVSRKGEGAFGTVVETVTELTRRPFTLGATTTTVAAAPFHPIPDGLEVVHGTARCDFGGEGDDSTDAVVCDLDLSDPRVSGTERHERFRYVEGGDDAGAWVVEEATIENDGGTWRGSVQAVDIGWPFGEARYVGDGAYLGLTFHYYFGEVRGNEIYVRGWISARNG